MPVKAEKKRELPILVYIKRTGKVGRLAMNDHPMMSGLSLTFFASLNSLSFTFHFFCVCAGYGIIFEKKLKERKTGRRLTAATLVL